eukprot:TRINITY_DN3500_c0_g1_i2.p1 TRINITY_DN3500_c0_g1~~TRINITY_DN3500_c0_g1_i2.p1  ORF type:complete len:132 (-),score=3.63 TRINITY_DN3500_c0_g1_i2:46-441(-)
MADTAYLKQALTDITESSELLQGLHDIIQLIHGTNQVLDQIDRDHLRGFLLSLGQYSCECFVDASINTSSVSRTRDPIHESGFNLVLGSVQSRFVVHEPLIDQLLHLRIPSLFQLFSKDSLINDSLHNTGE